MKLLKFHIVVSLLFALGGGSGELFAGKKEQVKATEAGLYKRVGIALVALGALGNLIAYINTLDPKPGTYLESAQAICAYEVPEGRYDLGVGRWFGGFCTKFWHKALFFSSGGIIGAYLMWLSRQICKKNEESR